MDMHRQSVQNRAWLQKFLKHIGEEREYSRETLRAYDHFDNCRMHHRRLYFTGDDPDTCHLHRIIARKRRHCNRTGSHLVYPA